MQDDILIAMRVMAWERAKGELLSILHTYFGGHPKFDAADEAINTFIKQIENNGIVE